MTKLLYVLGAIALLAIGFVLGVVGVKALPADSFGAGTGGNVVYTASHLVGDVYQGKSDVLLFSNGAWANAAFSTTGGITNSGSLTQTGAATLKCPITYNGATTTTAYYLYVSGTSVLATTTKPALCP